MCGKGGCGEGGRDGGKGCHADGEGAERRGQDGQRRPGSAREAEAAKAAEGAARWSGGGRRCSRHSGGAVLEAVADTEERRQKVSPPLPVSRASRTARSSPPGGCSCGPLLQYQTWSTSWARARMTAAAAAAVLGLDGVRVASVAAGSDHTLALSPTAPSTRSAMARVVCSGTATRRSACCATGRRVRGRARDAGGVW